MSHIFGYNWLRYHGDGTDIPHMQRFGVKSLTLYENQWGNRDFCNELLAALPPDVFFVLRDQPLGEQKEDMYRDPIATGRRHAKEWGKKFDSGRVFIPKDRCYIQGINEPDSNHAEEAIDAYTLHLVVESALYGIRVAGWVFGTGHPSTVGHSNIPGTPIDWHWYKASARALKEHGGIASFHAYGSWNNYAFDDHLLRMSSCPYELDCVIDEFGIDEGIISEDTAGQGWLAHLSAEQYMVWLNVAQKAVREKLAQGKLNLLSLEIFCYDTNSDWKSYNVKEQQSLLERTQWSSPVIKPGYVIHMPYVTLPSAGAQPPDPQPPEGNWQRSIAFVLGREGGLSSDVNDPGNWLGGKFVGTKYGISGAVWGDKYDIPNLTVEQAKQIYYDNYWLASGCDKLSWPLCLLHFDAAVQHGPTAMTLLEESDRNVMRYMATRIKFYTAIKTWDRYGAAWMNRMAALLVEMST